ncbi:MAG: hypothetical protein ACE5HP_07010 [Gemmatimonadota bacterium]
MKTALGIALALLVGRSGQRHPNKEEEMSKRLLVALTMFGLAACADAAGPTALDQGSTGVALAKGSSSDTRMQASLSGSAAFPKADGKARFRDRGGEQQLEVEVEDGPPNTDVDFFVGGNLIGSGQTDAFGDASIRLNSDEGDAVPAVGPGTSVAVKTAGGTLIVSGTF